MTRYQLQLLKALESGDRLQKQEDHWPLFSIGLPMYLLHPMPSENIATGERESHAPIPVSAQAVEQLVEKGYLNQGTDGWLQRGEAV